MKKRQRMTEAEMLMRHPLKRGAILQQLKQDMEAIRTAAELQVWGSDHAAQMVNNLGRLFWIVDHAATRCRLPPETPELRVIAGAANALADLGRRQQDIEHHRPSLLSGVLAVERLWPRLNPYALGIAAMDFDNAMAAAGLLRRINETAKVKGVHA